MTYTQFPRYYERYKGWQLALKTLFKTASNSRIKEALASFINLPLL